MVTRSFGFMVLGLLGVVSAPAQADHVHSSHVIARVADDMQDDLRELMHELRHHYRGNEHYHELQVHTQRVFSDATRLVILARAGRDVHGMHRVIDQLDDSYHTLEDTLRHADECWAETHPGHGWNPRQGCRIPHVRELMAHLDHHVHLVHDEIAKIYVPRHHGPVYGYSPNNYVPNYTPYGYSGGNYGYGYGTGSGLGYGYGGQQVYGRPSYDDSRRVAPRTSPTPGFTPYSPRDSGFSVNAGRLTFQLGR